MNLYKLLLILIAASYGGLTFFAGAFQLKQRKISLVSSISMIAGGLLLIFSLISNLSASYTLLILIAGLLIIQGVAISNGFQMFGRINPKHHAVRFGISVFIVVLFLLK